jgi:hypothetical protein
MIRALIVVVFGMAIAGCASPQDWRGRYVALDGQEEALAQCPEVLRIVDVARSGDRFELRGAFTYAGKNVPLQLMVGEDDGVARGDLDPGPDEKLTLPGQGPSRTRQDPMVLEDHVLSVGGALRIELWQPNEDVEPEFYTLSITSQAPPLRSATLHLGRVQ